MRPASIFATVRTIITIILNFKGCKIYGVCSSVGAFAEIWSLAAVSWDRYQAVFNPFNQFKRITKCQVIKLLSYIIYFHKVTDIWWVNANKIIDSFWRLTIVIFSYKANMLILIIWGLSVICSVLPLVGWSQFVSEVSKLPFTS